MNESIQQQIQLQARKAKSAMRVLSRSSADVRNHALLAMAESLQDSKDKIQTANRIDLENGEKLDSPRPSCNASYLTTKKSNGWWITSAKSQHCPTRLALSLVWVSVQTDSRSVPSAFLLGSSLLCMSRDRT